VPGATESILDSRLAVPDKVVQRTFEGEMLVLNLDTGQYHGLNESGGRLLELFEEIDGPAREAVAILAGEYEVQPSEIEDEMAAFCVALAERGLVEVAATDGDASGP
jgi:hypothetical protein